jgi:putative DNA primase/helicase
VVKKINNGGDAGTIALALDGQRKSDGGWLCRCPVKSHGRQRGDVNPSLSMADGDEKLIVFCHAGCDYRDVLDALRIRGLSNHRRSSTVDPRRQPTCDSAPSPDPMALAIWNSGKPASNSAVERYLLRRGIDILIPPAIRSGTVGGAGDQKAPAMIVAVRALGGAIVAVQRTRLTWDGTRADIPRPRMTFGALGDGAAHLAECRDILGIAEGTETALAATQLTGIPCWASLGSGRMPNVAIPLGVRELHVFADDDNAGRAAAAEMVKQHTASGRQVIVRYPPEGYNDFAGVTEHNEQERKAA